MEVTRANAADTHRLLGLWMEKARWLEDQGRPLWDLGQFTLEGLKAKYDDPAYFIARDAGAVVGGFILIDYDRRYWPEETNNDAVYLHKFLVCNGHNGKGYSARLLDWIGQYARQSQKRFVRLDYDADREKVARMYRGHGFVDVDTLVDERGQRLTRAVWEP